MHIARVPMIGSLVGELARTAPVGSKIDVSAFDLDVVSLVDATPTSSAGVAFVSALEASLDERFALGLTNLDRCLSQMLIASSSSAAASFVQRFVLISDGIATYGSTTLGQMLAATVAKLPRK